MTSKRIMDPYRNKEKATNYLVQVGLVVGGVKHDIH